MSRNVTPKNPCPICGKPDWCLIRDGENGPLFGCHRVDEAEVIANGVKYIQFKQTDQLCWYEEEEQRKAGREAYIAKLKAENPNWKPSKGKKAASPKKPSSPTTAKYVNRSNYAEMYNKPTEDGQILHKVYSALLDCCILEEDHAKILKDEWGEDIFNKITSRYPIRSLPMPDANRFKYGRFYKNLWRKAIIEKMKASGVTDEELSHTPMFYQLGSGEDEVWTFTSLSGILFPVYNAIGQIIRLRIKDDYPLAEGVFEGAEGQFGFYKDGWYFKAKEGDSKPFLVYQPKSKTYKVRLDKSGIPMSDGDKKSKVIGKYKNLSSFKEVYDDEKKEIRNKYKNGSQSGSYPSLYCKPTDNFAVVYFTEGEKKAMVANEILGAPCVSFPGVGTFSTAFEARCCAQSIVDYCVERGLRRGVLCYDADKSSNAMVLMQEKNCVKYFIEHNIELMIGDWSQAFGKGLDDILLKGIRPTLHCVK